MWMQQKPKECLPAQYLLYEDLIVTCNVEK